MTNTDDGRADVADVGLLGRGIVFTQYLMPDGRKQRTEIDRPAEIEALAQQFIDAGGWYESEMLSDFTTISLTACFKVDGQPDDIEIVLCRNGPEVLDAVDNLVRKSIEWLAKATRDAS
jgi:hypothetical protein